MESTSSKFSLKTWKSCIFSFEKMHESSSICQWSHPRAWGKKCKRDDDSISQWSHPQLSLSNLKDLEKKKRFQSKHTLQEKIF